MENNKKRFKLLPIIFIILFFVVIFNLFTTKNSGSFNRKSKSSINILSSYDNIYLEENIKEYASSNNLSVNFEYKGDLEIVEELNSNSKGYDAVWISNSMWLYMLNNTSIVSESKSISVSPVVVGLKNNKAKELGLIGKNITNNDVMGLIQDKKIKYVMSSVTQTNTGATAYLGFLNSLAGNPEILTEDMLKDETLIKKLINVFSGVERVSGNEQYLKQMFLNNDNYEAVIADESSLININNSLKEKNKEALYLLYPTDGVAINDSTFGYIDNGLEKEENFLKLQNYLLSGNGQKMLEESGRRTWYGGINKNANKTIFNPDWGIDTTNYLNVTKFPSKKVMTTAFNLYIERLRKPTHVVFCLDYSGSMYGSGIGELTNAMNYILDYNRASSDKLQFSSNDRITVITFSDKVSNVWTIDNGKNTSELLSNISNFDVGGSTALYDAIIEGLKILNSESDDYTKTVIAMTDGEVNVGSYRDLEKHYNNLKKEIPVYSITFGNANDDQLINIAELANSKVFDGKTNLLKAFKEVRGYN